MGELGGVVEYLYWSTRRTSRFMEDNGLAIQPATHTLTSPSFGWLPTFSRTRTSASGTRPQIAKAIDRALGQVAVTRFNSPGPIQYAKGTGVVVFGKFMDMPPPEAERQPAVMLTTVNYTRRDRESVFVCLFGSMDNFPEYIQGSGPCTDQGWTSSASRAVFSFIKSNGKTFDILGFQDTPGEMALAALQIARDQGTYRGHWQCTYGLDRPWQRAYTYGDAREAQWLAQIYLDVTREDFEAEDIPIEDYTYGLPVRRVLVGAPFWIRTPGPQAVRIYAKCDDLDMTPPEYPASMKEFKARGTGKHAHKRKPIKW